MHYEQLGKQVCVRLMTVSLSGLYYCFLNSWLTRYGMGICSVVVSVKLIRRLVTIQFAGFKHSCSHVRVNLLFLLLVCAHIFLKKVD